MLKRYQENQRVLAERVGFEPTLRLPVNRISSAAHSTTLPPLREDRAGLSRDSLLASEERPLADDEGIAKHPRNQFS